MIKKNWKSAGGRGAYLILKKNHTNRAALVVVNKLSRLWPESGPVSEEDGEGTKQSPNPTKGLLFIFAVAVERRGIQSDLWSNTLHFGLIQAKTGLLQSQSVLLCLVSRSTWIIW